MIVNEKKHDVIVSGDIQTPFGSWKDVETGQFVSRNVVFGS
jgi:hypothetical protein